MAPVFTRREKQRYEKCFNSNMNDGTRLDLNAPQQQQHGRSNVIFTRADVAEIDARNKTIYILCLLYVATVERSGGSNKKD